MFYENMRNEFASSIMDLLSHEQLIETLAHLDKVATKYKIDKQCTDIIVYDGVPEIVQHYIASLGVAGRTKGTLDNYYLHLRKFFQTVGKPYGQITSNDIRLYLFQYEQNNNIKKSTLDFIQRILKRFFSWLVDQEYITRNPTKNLEAIALPKTTRQALSPIWLEYLRMACETPREKALVDFLCSSGCRISECIALTLEDIDWRDRSVHIRHGKGDKERITFFDAETEVSLKQYLSTRKGDSNALFCCSRAPYDAVSQKSLQVELAKICSRTDLPFKVTPHNLRHTFATNMINHGMPIQDLQKLMGHSKLDTTMIYTHISDENVMYSYRRYAV